MKGCVLFLLKRLTELEMNFFVYMNIKIKLKFFNNKKLKIQTRT